MGAIMKFRIVLVTALAVPLAGCGVARVQEARLEYQQSAEAYKACVLARGVAVCEAQRVVMETDERKHINADASVYGNTTTHNVNVQRR
jgi:hypothetical protein